jgi:hypothetical protein
MACTEEPDRAPPPAARLAAARNRATLPLRVALDPDKHNKESDVSGMDVVGE